MCVFNDVFHCPKFQPMVVICLKNKARANQTSQSILVSSMTELKPFIEQEPIFTNKKDKGSEMLP